MTALPYPEKVHVSSDVTIKDDVSIVAFGDGYSQRMENGLNAQREDWSIVYPSLSRTELDAALTVFKAAGAVNALTWESPLDGVEKKYIVVKDSRKFQKNGAGWRLSLSLQQVFEP